MSAEENQTIAPVAEDQTEHAAEAGVATEKKSKKTLVVPAKVAKQIDSLQKKLVKEVERRKKAEELLKHVKAERSRVHRIPKPSSGETA